MAATRTSTRRPAPEPEVIEPEPVRLKKFHVVHVIEAIVMAESQEALNVTAAASQRAWEKPRGTTDVVEVRSTLRVAPTREKALPSAL